MSFNLILVVLAIVPIFGQATDECVKAHNEYRRLHGAPELVHDVELARFAKKWADQLDQEPLILRHSQSEKFGENIAWHSSKSTSCRTLVKMWYDEIQSYDFNNQGFTKGTGHFTQLVWKGTQRVGCAISNRHGAMLVCEYAGPGNIKGQYEENVSPPIADNKSQISKLEEVNQKANVVPTRITGGTSPTIPQLDPIKMMDNHVLNQISSNFDSSTKQTQRSAHFSVDIPNNPDLEKKLINFLTEQGLSYRINFQFNSAN